jgi:hypothetical protein
MRDIAVAITIGVAVLVLLAMAFAWRRRLRRDSPYSAPLGVPEHAEVLSRHAVLYVSTTRHDEPLERLAIAPLAYRARGELEGQALRRRSRHRYDRPGRRTGRSRTDRLERRRRHGRRLVPAPHDRDARNPHL